MISLFRSRTMMKALVTVCIFALVVTGAIGLFTAREAPQEQMPEEGAPEGVPEEPPEEPVEAPEMGTLGSPPNRIDYADRGEECDAYECGLIVGVESGDLDGEEAIDTIYGTLLERDFAILLPPGEEDPEDLDQEELRLTDENVIVHGAPEPAEEDDVAFLIVLNAEL